MSVMSPCERQSPESVRVRPPRDLPPARDRQVPKKKFCFLNKARPCDLTCKAAFEVDDPVDNLDCFFHWASHHFGEGLFEVRRILETMGGPSSGDGGGSGGPGSEPARGPKGHSDN